jgi:hypothetical protein
VNYATNQQADAHALEAAQAHLGLRVAARLTESADGVGHDITERLRFAREQALERARASRRVAAEATSAAVIIQSSSTAALSGPPSLWLRLASLLPLVVLVGGLVLIHHVNDREDIAAAAEIDAVLLADELPPAAYSDPGFSEFLKSPIH